MVQWTRRELLVRSAGAAGALWLGGAGGTSTGAAARGEPFAGGELLGTAPFVGEAGGAVGKVVGAGLTGRLALDLTRLRPESPVVSREDFFIRTLPPARLPPAAGWTLSTEGLVREPETLSLATLRERERPLREVLLECSGNGPHRHFGLLSSARWSGVPLAEVLERLPIARRATRVEVGGFDRHQPPYGSSTPGASWIFTFDQLAAAGASLALGMNGAGLPVRHGGPVRLLVPNWFGCCSAKWVDRIRFLDDTAPATSQMHEFAGRTHQDGVPELARDYRPARIDVQAMPVRVERWRLAAGGIGYRLVGIVWGGERPVDDLMIRLDPAGRPRPPRSEHEGWEPVDRVTRRDVATWGFWSHTWRPEARATGGDSAGRYTIRLRPADPSVPSLRLDQGYYDRTFEVLPGES